MVYFGRFFSSFVYFWTKIKLQFFFRKRLLLLHEIESVMSRVFIVSVSNLFSFTMHVKIIFYCFNLFNTLEILLWSMEYVLDRVNVDLVFWSTFGLRELVKFFVQAVLPWNALLIGIWIFTNYWTWKTKVHDLLLNVVVELSNG